MILNASCLFPDYLLFDGTGYNSKEAACAMAQAASLLNFRTGFPEWLFHRQ